MESRKNRVSAAITGQLTGTSFCGGVFLNDQKSKRQVIYSYLHYGGLNESS